MFEFPLARNFAWSSVLVLAGWVSLGGGAAVGKEASVVRGPYLQQATPDSIVVVWRTAKKIEPTVWIGESPDALSRKISGDAIALRVSVDVDAPKDVPRLYEEPQEEAAKRDPRDHDPSTAPDTFQYEAAIDGLQPATRYYYAVYDGDRRLAGGDKHHYLETSPARGSDADLRIWVVGDSGTGREDQQRVHDAMVEFCQETRRDLDLYMHVGDMAYGDGTDYEFQHHFFAPYQYTLRNTVCWPTMGNHEGHTSRGLLGIGPYYDAYVVPTEAEAGGLQSGTEAYYSFDIADVHFVCLDSHDLDRAPTGAMAKWLVADLEEAQGDWLIAFWHHPPYTKGSHDSDAESQLIEMRKYIMPILEAGGVDIVLTGHSHIYERSMLIDGAYATPTTAKGVILDDGDGHPDGDGPYRKSKGRHPHEGTVSIVTGHGGASLSRRGTMPIMREIIVEHGSVILDVVGDTLTGSMVNKNNVVRDLFRIVKQGKVEVARVKNPWQPVHDVSKITQFAVGWKEDVVGEAPKQWTVVRGEGGSMTIAGDGSPQIRSALVKAGDESVIATYNDFEDGISAYQTWIDIEADSKSSAGLVFGYVDENNYYAYRIDPAAGKADLVRCIDGKEEVATTRKVDTKLGGVVKIKLEPVGTILEVHLNRDMEYTINLKERLPIGKLGIYVGPNTSARYGLFGIQRGLP